MKGRYFIGQTNEESRQRIRRVGISMPLIEEVAIIENFANEETANIHALRLTYSNMPLKNWILDGEEILGYTLTKEPIREFYDEPIYLLEVYTYMEPIIKEKEI